MYIPELGIYSETNKSKTQLLYPLLCGHRKSKNFRSWLKAKYNKAYKSVDKAARDKLQEEYQRDLDNGFEAFQLTIGADSFFDRYGITQEEYIYVRQKVMELRRLYEDGVHISRKTSNWHSRLYDAFEMMIGKQPNKINRCVQFVENHGGSSYFDMLENVLPDIIVIEKELLEYLPMAEQRGYVYPKKKRKRIDNFCNKQRGALIAASLGAFASIHRAYFSDYPFGEDPEL